MISDPTMTKAHRVSALLGSLGLFLIASAFYWRMAPFSPSSAALALRNLTTIVLIVAGVALLFKSNFLGLLKTIELLRRQLTDEQKIALRALTIYSIGLVLTLPLGTIMGLFAPMLDGRFGYGGSRLVWIAYLAGYAIFSLSLVAGTIARFREIDVLFQLIDGGPDAG